MSEASLSSSPQESPSCEILDISLALPLWTFIVTDEISSVIVELRHKVTVVGLLGERLESRPSLNSA